MICALARSIDSKRFKWRKFLAVHSGNTDARLELRIKDVTPNRTGYIEIAAPASVLTNKEAGNLTERSARPFSLQINRHLADGGGAMQRAFDTEEAGVRQIQIEIGADRLRLEAKSPFIGISEPHGKIGIEEREGLFLVADFEIDAGVAGFNVGETGRTPGSALRCGRVGNMRGLKQHGPDVPAALSVADEIQAGLIEADTANFKAAPPQ